MIFHETFAQLANLCRSEKDFESQILDLVGKYRDSGIFAESGLLPLLTRFRSWILRGRTDFPEDSLFLGGPEFYAPTRNARVLLGALQREVFLSNQHPICLEHDNPTVSRFLYPFVLPVCLKTSGPLDGNAYHVSFNQMKGIRKRCREFFGGSSFSDPVLFNVLYPVSAFRLNSALNRQIHSTVNGLGDALYYRNVPPVARPHFEGLCDPKLEEYCPHLQRSYGFLFGVAFIEADVAKDPLSFIRELVTAEIRIDYKSGIQGGLGGFSSEIPSVMVSQSRLTINRPLPALEGYDHFVADIQSSDSSAYNFWKPYSE